MKLVSGFTQACKVRESFKILCKLLTATAVVEGILKELPKFNEVPVGVAEINTFLTGLPALKLTFPVITAVGFLNPIPVIKEEYRAGAFSTPLAITLYRYNFPPSVFTSSNVLAEEANVAIGFPQSGLVPEISMDR